jgi:hypothetical protein
MPLSKSRHVDSRKGNLTRLIIATASLLLAVVLYVSLIRTSPSTGHTVEESPFIFGTASHNRKPSELNSDGQRKSQDTVDTMYGDILNYKTSNSPKTTTSRQVPTAASQPAPLRAKSTLIIYVYNARDEKEVENFHFFLKYGIDQTSGGAMYHIILSSGGNIKYPGELPTLPPNASLITTESCTSSVWGIIASVTDQLPLGERSYYMVVDSSVRGPYLPPYATSAAMMHWSDAYTSRLNDRVKLVGGAINCEGAPRGGDAAGEWREHPYVLPWAWATDAAGWELIRKSQGGEVFKCYDNSWDVRYHSDSGASLAIMESGHAIDTLMTKYQGVDWWNKATWTCNGKVRPDGELTYDGISLSPFETLFVPVNDGAVMSGWTAAKTAEKYESWMEETHKKDAVPVDVISNEWVTQGWRIKAEKLVTMNARGPGCFDFSYYLEHNPDIEELADVPLLLWEHFLVLGQFQGRPHRFSCPVQIGHAYRLAYLRARGRRCFDQAFYLRHNLDLVSAGLKRGHDLWGHWTNFGQWENRRAR